MKVKKLKKALIVSAFSGLLFMSTVEVNAFESDIKDFNINIEIDATTRATDPKVKKMFRKVFYYSSEDDIPDQVWYSEAGYSGYLHYTGKKNYEDGMWACKFSGYLWKGPFVPPKAIRR